MAVPKMTDFGVVEATQLRPITPEVLRRADAELSVEVSVSLAGSLIRVGRMANPIVRIANPISEPPTLLKIPCLVVVSGTKKLICARMIIAAYVSARDAVITVLLMTLDMIALIAPTANTRTLYQHPNISMRRGHSVRRLWFPLFVPLGTIRCPLDPPLRTLPHHDYLGLGVTVAVHHPMKLAK